MTCHPSLYMPMVILITNVFSLLAEDRKVDFNLDSQHLQGYRDALHLGKKVVCQSFEEFEEHGR